jgi:hypothetical protein
VRRLVLTPTYGSYGDVELLSDLLVSMGGVYNVYREGGSIVVELDDKVSPAEVVRRVLDLGHELALPHYVFVTKPNQDERRVMKRLMESPYVVAAEYYPRSGRGVLVAVPGAAEEEVVRVLKEVFGGSVRMESTYVQPVRLSFG